MNTSHAADDRATGRTGRTAERSKRAFSLRTKVVTGVVAAVLLGAGAGAAGLVVAERGAHQPAVAAAVAQPAGQSVDDPVVLDDGDSDLDVTPLAGTGTSGSASAGGGAASADAVEPQVDAAAQWVARHDAELTALLQRGERLTQQAQQASENPARVNQLAADMLVLSKDFDRLANTASDTSLRWKLRDVSDAQLSVSRDMEDYAAGLEDGDLDKMSRANESLAEHVSEHRQALNSLSAYRAAHN